MKASNVIAILIVIIVGIFAVVIFTSNTNAVDLSPVKNAGEFKIFKSQTCGCCALFGSYVQGKGIPAAIVQMDDLTELKAQMGIPSELQSCHTSTVGGYFIEGHIPLEVTAKLLKEKPDIAGIALPGMPQGSPGMPGQKTGAFMIKAIRKDGTYYDYMAA